MSYLFVTAIVVSVTAFIASRACVAKEDQKSSQEVSLDNYIGMVDCMAKITEDPQVRKLASILDEFSGRQVTADFNYSSKGEVA